MGFAPHGKRPGKGRVTQTPLSKLTINVTHGHATQIVHPSYNANIWEANRNGYDTRAPQGGTLRRRAAGVQERRD